MGEHFDSLETRVPEIREREQFVELRRQIANAKANAPYFSQLLADVDPEKIVDRAALAKLPITRKSSLIELQQKAPPFGGMLAVPLGSLARIFQSPGPINDPEGDCPNYWRSARAQFAVGIRKGDVVLNGLAYHMSPGGRIMESGLRALGCAVIPGGVGQSELQAQMVASTKPSAYTGTPSFLKIILDKAGDMGLDASSIKRAVVSGEALPPSLRAEFKSRGVEVYQCYAIGDFGVLAYESPALEGMIVDEGVFVEIVRPGTGDPVPDGEVGEVVVTNLAQEYPLIRFATGDLSAILPGISPCGRTNIRIKGWMGRADQTTKVKGMFVHPEQVAAVVARHPEIKRARLVVENPGGTDRMTLKCETEGSSEGLCEAIGTTIQALTKLKGHICFVEPGTLPNDGKVIEDIRKYE
jgi:phenylacetate-CoA ligase